MGKIKKGNRNNRDSKPKDVSDTEEYADAVDPDATDFIYDNVDEYFVNQEREGAEKLAKLMKKPRRVDQEEVLGVASSSDEEEISLKRSKKKKKRAYEEAEPLPRLDSDLEEEKEDDEEFVDEWGKKSAYYNADYVDEEWDDADESGAEIAELEEKEALAIQQRMAQQLEDADFGLDFITHLKEADKIKEAKPAEEEKIDVNLSKLTKREKLKLLGEESPELLELAEDFKVQMTELKETLQPILKLVSDKVLPPSPGVNYIKARYNLIINYCTQIGYYFILKSKRISVQNHPVIKRLVQFRSLLHQLESAGSKLQPEIDSLLEKIKEQKEVLPEEFVRTVAPPKKRLRILTKTTAKPSKEAQEVPTILKSGKKKQTNGELTKDEQDALQFYKAVRQKKDDGESSSDDGEEAPGEDQTISKIPEEEEEEVGKRGINYQIAKNKGLTPHRPKEQRNPRVKHRMKFKKANIRRKGAIREPRKELQRYGGENSGIKATVIRSVKLK